jgi:hypothetical protein
MLYSLVESSLIQYIDWVDFIVCGVSPSRSRTQDRGNKRFEWMQGIPRQHRQFVWEKLYKDIPIIRSIEASTESTESTESLVLSIGSLTYRVGVAFYLGMRFLVIRVNFRDDNIDNIQHPFLTLGVNEHKPSDQNAPSSRTYTLFDDGDSASFSTVHLAINQWHQVKGSKLKKGHIKTLLESEPKTWLYYCANGQTNAFVPSFYSF